MLTGAGFSKHATNFNRREFPNGSELAKVILTDLAVPAADQADFDLRTATTKFMRDTGNDAGRLVRVLAPHLTAKKTTIDQQKLSM